MTITILASLILFSVFLSRIISRNKKQQKTEEYNFWERERQANSVRRKSLEHLDYIKIPLDRLPTGLLPENTTVKECLEILKSLETLPIVNLTGYSNTDLKLEYGTANITPLSEYDQNYTVLVRTLQKWADILWENNYISEAAAIMEFAISTHTDISHTYYKLAELYSSMGETDKIQELLATAEGLHSLSRDAIVRTLQESYL